MRAGFSEETIRDAGLEGISTIQHIRILVHGKETSCRLPMSRMQELLEMRGKPVTDRGLTKLP